MRALNCSKCGTAISAFRIGSSCFMAVKCPACKAKMTYPRYRLLGTFTFLAIVIPSLVAANLVTDVISQGQMHRSTSAYFITLGVAYFSLSYGIGKLLLKHVQFRSAE